MTRRCLLAASLLSFGVSCVDDVVDDRGTIVVVQPPADMGSGSGSDQPPAVVFEWRATILSNDVLHWSVTGAATVREISGNNAFTASISLRNDLTGTARPWHVHAGTCADAGGIVGEDAAYPRLSIGTDGAAAATVMIRGAALDPEQPYHVNVHESNAQFTTLIACGDLILQ